MSETLCHFIDGRSLAGSGHMERRNPSDTREVVALVPQGGELEAAAAAQAARAAFPAWSRATPEFRADVLDRAGRALIERSPELGRRLAREEGKLVSEAVAEAVRAGRIFRYFAGEALRAHGRSLASVRPDVSVETHPEAVGVFVLITPWNFPLAIPSWKTAPALAFGNTVVLKPSSMSALLAADLAEILQESGAPPGVFNIVYGEAEAGEALLRRPEIDGVSFTGSRGVGDRIACIAAERRLRVQMEMGGKNPLVVLDDADLDRSVACAMDGAFGSTGQRCTASSRIICTDGVYDRFVERFVARASALRVGHALDPDSQMGPLAFSAQFEKSLSYIEGVRDSGIRILAGGAPVHLGTPGWYLPATVIAAPDPLARVNQEEVFGPLASILPARDLSHAIELANATPFGLSAGIMTASLSSARRFRREARAGMVMVNLATAGVDYHSPFGGMRASSYGHREQGYAAIDFYTHIKTAYVWS